MNVIYAIPGRLMAKTGGYAYARELLNLLPGLGIQMDYCPLSSRFPDSMQQDIEDAVQAIGAKCKKGSVLLADCLAFGAMPGDAIRRLGLPIIALCHHPLGFETGFSPVRREELIDTEKRALALADHVIVTSAATARTLLREFEVCPERLTVAPPGTAKAQPARPGKDALKILAVGSITPRKAFHILIEALSALTHFEWHLDIAGSTQLSPATSAGLQAQIDRLGLRERVTFLEEVERETLDGLFRQSHIFVSSSLYEGFGMALAEALAHGLPIVTTTGGAADETIPAGAGLKVPPGSVSALREALAALMANPDLRSALSARAWRAGQDLPEWSGTAAIIASVIRRVSERMP